MKSLKKIVSLFLLMTLLLSMLGFAFASTEMVKHDNHEHSAYETSRGCSCGKPITYDHCRVCHNSMDECTCKYCPVCHHKIVIDPLTGTRDCQCNGL